MFPCKAGIHLGEAVLWLPLQSQHSEQHLEKLKFITLLLLWLLVVTVVPLPRSSGAPAAGVVPGGSAIRRLMISCQSITITRQHVTYMAM